MDDSSITRPKIKVLTATYPMLLLLFHNFFFGRKKCVYALTSEPLFETKTGALGASKFANNQANAKNFIFLNLFSYSQMSFTLLLYEAFHLFCKWKKKELL